ncbi:hypothetical protein D0T84_01115 [Dysgonomonas sp. 521]|uniref:hypothetical protein n=1 Tax=Dysgonomonas sp. 521 TaxID=2302932 RepID=UPI0013D476D0|nr:hypothetical protein [Dysgonomonas sp. 521]NDV93516.1 hypothetical protein [Dysgonomonas sp. 521]
MEPITKTKLEIAARQEAVNLFERQGISGLAFFAKELSSIVKEYIDAHEKANANFKSIANED